MTAFLPGIPAHRAIVLGILLAAGVTRAAASTIIAPTDDPTVTAQMYRDEAMLYPMVGKVTGGFSGSGVMISDRWVLTAGHVSYARTSGTFLVGGTSYTIQTSYTYPGYVFGSDPYDLGLLYLSSAVTGVGAATMLHSNPSDSILGKEATWVGFGFTGTGLTGAQATLEMRAFTNVIDVLGPAYGLTATSFVADFDRPDGSTNADAELSSPAATRLEGNVAPGDSGGGVFLTVDGQPYLVGINSYTGAFSPAGSNSKYGSLSGASNLSLLDEWVFQTTGIAAVPEPGALWLGVLGGLLGWRRRR